MAGEGVTVIVTTHYLDEAEHCDRIALIHAGRLVALGTVAELKEVFAGRARAGGDAARASLDALERAGAPSPGVLRGRRSSARACTWWSTTPRRGARRDRGGARGATATCRPRVERIVPSLEDVFIHCIEAEEARAPRAAGVDEPAQDLGRRARRSCARSRATR